MNSFIKGHVKDLYFNLDRGLGLDWKFTSWDPKIGFLVKKYVNVQILKTRGPLKTTGLNLGQNISKVIVSFVFA